MFGGVGGGCEDLQQAMPGSAASARSGNFGKPPLVAASGAAPPAGAISPQSQTVPVTSPRSTVCTCDGVAPPPPCGVCAPAPCEVCTLPLCEVCAPLGPPPEALAL